MNTTTQMKKGKDGWSAENTIVLDEAVLTELGKYGRRELKISTHKDSRGGLISFAGVSVVSPEGWRSTIIFGDYHKTLIRDPSARCTEKTVINLHAQAMKEVDAIVAEAKAFYEAKALAKRQQIDAEAEALSAVAA